MSESSMSHGRDCAVQEEKYPKTGLARKASRAQLRNAFSHIALICEDFCLQLYLSQVLLGKGRTVSAELHRRWTPLAGRNAKLWRGEWARINDKVVAAIIRELGQVLRMRAGGREAILLLEAHKCQLL